MASQGTNKRLLFEVTAKRRFNLLVQLLPPGASFQKNISSKKSQSPGPVCPVHRDAM